MIDGQTSSFKLAGNFIGGKKVHQKRRRRLRSRRSLQRLFQEYVEERKDELEAESARRHDCAQHGMLGGVATWPLSKAGWLS